MVSPFIIGLGVAGLYYLVGMFKKPGQTVDGMPAATSGNTPVPSGTRTASQVVGQSGYIYNVLVYADGSDIKTITAELVGQKLASGQVMQLVKPTAWVLFKQSMSTGRLSGLKRGKDATAPMLIDFGLNNIA